MDTREQLRAAPFIQFTNTICAQLAADLLRQQLITMSTTGTAQRQQVARKEVLKSALWRPRIFKGGKIGSDVQMTINLHKMSDDMLGLGYVFNQNVYLDV